MMRVNVLIFTLAGAAVAWQGTSGWVSKFKVEKKGLSATGVNRYFILRPGHTLWYEHGKDTLVTTVLNETKKIHGVDTRVVEDRETKNGQLSELTRDYFAIDEKTRDVYYFGEDVDEYRKGKVTGHSGAWLSGINGAQFGLMMPGSPEIGQKFYQEVAPEVAMDRAEVVSAGESVMTPAGVFSDCIRIRETNPLEKGSPEYKWYAPGVGMVKDGEFVLVKWRSAEPN